MQDLLNPPATSSYPTAPSTKAAPYPKLQEILDTAERLRDKVTRTPVWQWRSGVLEQQFNAETEVWLKLELFQKTGTFKLRGALNCAEAMDPAAKRLGVVAASAGNHAIAVAYAAKLAGTHAKVVMPESASSARVTACRDHGAEVILLPTVHEAFAMARSLVGLEGRTMIHPFDGPLTAQGTATVGLELMQQVGQLDAVLVPIGGGGLCGGIAAAVKQLNPRCQVFGVEPYGADAMYRSFHSGKPEQLDKVETIADSLGAPYAMDYSFGLCRRFVDEVVRVDDDALCRAMFYLYRDAKLVAEPAAGAATAALLGPLRERLNGKRVALLVCGSNIDGQRYAELLARGAQLVLSD